MATAPFPVNPALTAIAVRYRNPSIVLIADQVLPRVPPRGTKEFKYLVYALADGFTVPDTRVGRLGQPPRVEFSASERTGICLDYGLEDAVPLDDITQAAASAAQGGVVYDPEATATEYCTDLLLLDREIRVAGLVFDPATYPAGNKVQLAGAQQFDDFDHSDPLGTILTAMDATQVYRPNTVVMGQAVWTKLRQHPKIVKAVLGNAGDSGAATREQVAALLEVQSLLVGSGFVNNARKGQQPSLSRVWGKHMALLYLNPTATAERGVTFGFTQQYAGQGGVRVTTSTFDKNVGLRGGNVIRVGETVKEVICAPETGYFIQDAVA